MDSGFNNELDFNGLMMHHLDRISHLCTTLAGDIVRDSGVVLSYKENDKIEAFAWAVRFLTNVIPDGLKDKTYNENTDRLKKENKSNDPTDFTYNIGLFRNAINLLHRLGLLMPEELIGGEE